MAGEISSESAVKPVAYHFHRLQGVYNEASRTYVILPAQPQFLPVFIGALQELFRMPKALASANENDADKDRIEKIDKEMKELRTQAFEETQRFLGAVRNREDYMFPLDFYDKLNDLYDEVYALLARKGLLLPTEVHVDVRKSMKDRAGE